MKILVEISFFTREVELRKMTAYLKYKYRTNQRKINYSEEYEYLLPFKKHIMASSHSSKEIIQCIKDYNNEVYTLDEVWPS
jgi:hypothetical protein